MNQAEFLKLVMPFKDKMFRLAKRLLISADEAHDATQDVLLKLWNTNKRIKAFNNLEAYAMTMTKNHCLDRLKSKQAQHLKIVHSNYQDYTINAQQQLELQDSLSWIEKIMTTLPEQQQLVIQLRDIEHYSFKTISQMLDITETNVRVNLSRARKTIREQLTKTHNYGIT